MGVVPLTSYVVDGQTKWTLVSERTNVTLGGKSSFAQNRKRIGLEKNHKCNTCSFSTHVGSNLRIHMRRHNSEKIFKCDQCSYEGNQKAPLDMHVRSVHNDLWHRCEHCNYKASQKSNLKIHIQIKHEGMVYYTSPPPSSNLYRGPKDHSWKRVFSFISY